jgi:ArsR family metal-binding transcriptional regulator
MSIAMWQEIKALKARVEALEKAKAPKVEVAPLSRPKMCPKCGEQPAYFFHVKNCKGQNKNNNGSTKETSG